MQPLTRLLRGLGAAGAAANARDELDRIHASQVTAAIVVRHVQQQGSRHLAAQRAA